jgi:hypothetical protein
MTPAVENLRDNFRRVQRRALAVAVVAAVVSAIGAAIDPTQFLRSYLLAYLFVLAFPLGSFAIVHLHHLTGGSWGFTIRRLLEGAMRTLPWMAIAFVPIAVGLDAIYPWTDPELVAANEIVQHRAPYLNAGFFLVRAAIYFAVWIALMLLQLRLSARFDRRGDQVTLRRMRTLAGPALGLYALTMTFAAFDWCMSLEPDWSSTIFGIVMIVGQALTTMAFAVIVSTWLGQRAPFDRWMSTQHFHDLGKLLFAFVMLWAYVNYSQYLIIWSGNLPEETSFYRHRMSPGWRAVAIVLIVFHFALPFLVLLSRKVKKSPRLLASLALFLIALRWVDLAWIVAPSYRPGVFALHWLDLAVAVGLFAAWIALYVAQLKGRPLVSLHDAQLEALLEGGRSPHATEAEA